MKPTICISIGDVNGIGPEVVLKAIKQVDLSSIRIAILTNPSVIDFYLNKLSISLSDKELDCIDIITPDANFLSAPHPGYLKKEAGLHAMQSIEKGIELTLSGQAQALVTAPISKDAANKAGYHIPGHTEFLAKQTSADDVLMTLVSEQLRVALVTTHIPVSAIASSISISAIVNKAILLHNSLKDDFGISEPKIAVFGLNPHAGDGGIMGTEEIDIIKPAINKLNALNINAQGPFPADGFFGSNMHEQFDGILAMYHDQGLAPFKALSFGKGINFTAGLPIIRTSPDHGTAFDIAGKNIADPSSFTSALQLAITLVERKYDY